MIFETKEGSFEKSNKQEVVYYGELIASGSGSIRIPCRGHPIEVDVHFSDTNPPPPGCGPIPVDTVDIEIEPYLPTSHFPLWAIKITWDIQSGIRDIAWSSTVIRN